MWWLQSKLKNIFTATFSVKSYYGLVTTLKKWWQQETIMPLAENLAQDNHTNQIIKIGSRQSTMKLVVHRITWRQFKKENLHFVVWNKCFQCYSNRERLLSKTDLKMLFVYIKNQRWTTIYSEILLELFYQQISIFQWLKQIFWLLLRHCVSNCYIIMQLTEIVKKSDIPVSQKSGTFCSKYSDN